VGETRHGEGEQAGEVCAECGEATIPIVCSAPLPSVVHAAQRGEVALSARAIRSEPAKQLGFRRRELSVGEDAVLMEVSQLSQAI
jgi:hypothetical protein